MNLHVGAVVKSFVDSFDDSERKNNVENDLPEIRDARIEFNFYNLNNGIIFTICIWYITQKKLSYFYEQKIE